MWAGKTLVSAGAPAVGPRASRGVLPVTPAAPFLPRLLLVARLCLSWWLPLASRGHPLYVHVSFPPEDVTLELGPMTRS